MKDLKTLRKLAQNPFYKMTDEEIQVLQEAEARADKPSKRTSSVYEDYKKKESKSHRGAAAVKETGKLKKHSSDPVTE